MGKRAVKIGSLVWYNVGGGEQKSIGIVVGYRSKVPIPHFGWGLSGSYLECIKVHWVSKGNYMPRPIDVSSSQPLIEYIGEEQIIVYDTPLSHNNWYEVRLFKIISEVK